MRAGFYGTGDYAAVHAECLRRLGAAITACWGTNPEKTAAFANRFGAKVYNSFEHMVRPDVIDVLYIVIPPFAHDGGVERLALKRGIPFLCEKPVGLDLRLCRDIAEQVDSTKLVTSGGYQTRMASVNAEVRRILDHHEISFVRSWWLGGCPNKNWWRTMSQSGGQMVEQATHFLDLMRYLFGPIRRVGAMTNRGIIAARHPGADIYDTMNAIMAFESGVIGEIIATSVMSKTAAGRVIFQAGGDGILLEYGPESVRYREGDQGWKVMDGIDWARLNLDLNRNFLDAAAVADPGMVVGSYLDAVDTLAVTLAMNASAEEGQFIELEEKMQS